MRIAISNIAWNITEDEKVAELLKAYDIDAIDVAPAKYFSNFDDADDERINFIKTWWANRNIEIVGMQALLFGTTGLNIFAATSVQNSMLEHLRQVCRIAAGLGARRLVFGSPKNRDCTGLSNNIATDLAVNFFRRLGAIAESYGVVICLEPNPPCYGANFMTNSHETAQIVKHVAHPAIMMQFDTGALTINGEDPVDVLESYSSLVGHIHASEPDLVTLGDGATAHREIHDQLYRYLPDHIVSIEMLASKTEPHTDAIQRALKIAVNNYR